MKRTLLFTALAICIFSACNSSLDIQQVYSFDLRTMPVPKRMMQGETVEIRCQIVKDGNYRDARYFVRYFQPDGKGELRLDDGRVLVPNDLYPLKNDVFRLYYTSCCTDQQTIDVYIEDGFGQVVQKSFSFQNETEKKEE
jgi:hypothetical protein